jgi:DNA-binding NarL/FixJ family response regulator
VTKATRVLVADAHLPTRTGIRLLLERSGFEVCAEAANADAAVAAAQREQPEICLVDADLPGGGMLATARITSRMALLTHCTQEHRAICLRTPSRKAWFALCVLSAEARPWCHATYSGRSSSTFGSGLGVGG